MEENGMTFPSSRRRSIAEIMEEIAAHRRAIDMLTYEAIGDPRDSVTVPIVPTTCGHAKTTDGKL